MCRGIWHGITTLVISPPTGLQWENHHLAVQKFIISLRLPWAGGSNLEVERSAGNGNEREDVHCPLPLFLLPRPARSWQHEWGLYWAERLSYFYYNVIRPCKKNLRGGESVNHSRNLDYSPWVRHRVTKTKFVRVLVTLERKTPKSNWVSQ